MRKQTLVDPDSLDLDHKNHDHNLDRLKERMTSLDFEVVHCDDIHLFLRGFECSIGLSLYVWVAGDHRLLGEEEQSRNVVLEELNHMLVTGNWMTDGVAVPLMKRVRLIAQNMDETGQKAVVEKLKTLVVGVEEHIDLPLLIHDNSTFFLSPNSVIHKGSFSKGLFFR